MFNSTAILDLSEILNPLTPMAWLRPSLAAQATLRDYVAVGACSVLVWDVLDNLRNDYKLLTRYNIRLPTVVYFAARIGALGYSISATIFATASITDDCARFAKVVASFYPVAVTSASLLFFFRLKAVFNDSMRIVALFAFVWLALVASTIAYPFGPAGMHIGPTGYCAVGAPKFVVAPIMISLVYDTLTLFAISWKLMANTHIDHDIRTGVKTMVRGHYLPAFSRALLQDAQLYYMVTLPLNLLSAVMVCVKFAPPTLRVMTLVPNNVVINIMACRVFRNTKLGLIPESPTTSHILAPGRYSIGHIDHSPGGRNDVSSLPITFKPPTLTSMTTTTTASRNGQEAISTGVRSIPESVLIVHVTTIVEREDLSEDGEIEIKSRYGDIVS